MSASGRARLRVGSLGADEKVNENTGMGSGQKVKAAAWENPALVFLEHGEAMKE